MTMEEVHAEVAATLAALARLKLAVCTPVCRGRKSRAMTMADDLRDLDKLYTAHSGVQLLERTSPVYRGPLYEWSSSREDVTRRVMQALARLRRSPVIGVHMNTHFAALNYFSDLWPVDLEWPRSIPRPSKRKGAA